MEHSHKVLLQAQLFQQEQEEIDRRLRATLSSDTTKDAAAQFEACMVKLQRLDVAEGYVSLILQVHELSEEARKAIRIDPKAALVPYSKLQHLSKDLKTRHEALEDAAVHLVDYVEKNTNALWDEMKSKLADQFEEVLARIAWPTPTANINEAPEFASVFEKLLILQEPYVFLTVLLLFCVYVCMTK
jgi:hypothetical protein